MRLIDAEAAKNALYELKKKGISFIPTSFICDTIDNVPTIEAKPVVHAHWDENRCCTHCERTYMDIAIAVWEDFSENEGDIPSWCPYCGAQMDESISRGHENDNHIADPGEE